MSKVMANSFNVHWLMLQVSNSSAW